MLASSAQSAGVWCLEAKKALAFPRTHSATFSNSPMPPTGRDDSNFWLVTGSGWPGSGGLAPVALSDPPATTGRPAASITGHGRDHRARINTRPARSRRLRHQADATVPITAAPNHGRSHPLLKSTTWALTQAPVVVGDCVLNGYFLVWRWFVWRCLL